MEKCCLVDSGFTFTAGNQGSYKVAAEFEFRPDRTTHFGVTCPYLPMFDLVWSIASSFLNGSSPYLQVTRIAIHSQKCSNLSQLGLFTLSDETFFHRLIMDKMLSGG